MCNVSMQDHDNGDCVKYVDDAPPVMSVIVLVEDMAASVQS